MSSTCCPVVIEDGVTPITTGGTITCSDQIKHELGTYILVQLYATLQCCVGYFPTVLNFSRLFCTVCNNATMLQATYYDVVIYQYTNCR